jgi:hypothetical protein
LSLRVALLWCDHVILLDHASDPPIDVEFDIGERVTILRDDSPGWDEMRHRQRMLAAAREHGATHIAITDCDEILTADSLPFIRSEIESLTPIVATNVMLYPRLYNMRGTPTRYHLNGIWGNRSLALAFKDTPAAHWSGDMFHHREPHGVSWMHGRSTCRVMHLWGVTERRLIARHQLYKLSERSRWPNKPVPEIDAQYNLAIRPRVGEAPWTFAEAPVEWWDKYRPLMDRYLDLDRAPWQEQRVREILSERPGLAAGLDLFGLGREFVASV